MENSYCKFMSPLKKLTVSEWENTTLEQCTQIYNSKQTFDLFLFFGWKIRLIDQVISCDLLHKPSSCVMGDLMTARHKSEGFSDETMTNLPVFCCQFTDQITAV